MAETSGIAWTRSTFNPWVGCTKVGPGCDHCYAEVSSPARAFGIRWGAGQPRHRTSIKNWGLPLRWNKLAAIERQTGKVLVQSKGWHTPGFWPVFCASLADVFDNEIPQEWRTDLWRLIEQTPHLSWLLVTKRIGNVAGMVPSLDWLRFHDNVRILITVVNQEEADRDIPKLLALPCKNGISYEPALGPVDWVPWLRPAFRLTHDPNWKDLRNLEWIIVGGESNQGQHKARPFNIEWARSTVRQCKDAGVPAFVKQIGSQPRDWCVNRLLDDQLDPLMEEHYCDLYEADETSRSCDRCTFLKDRAGADPEEWPEDLRVREFPR